MDTISNDANLVNLTLSFGTLNPGFAPNQLSYVVTVPYQATGNRTVTATPVLPDGAREGPNSVRTASVDANNREAQIIIVVISQSGTVSRTYTITVRMSPDDNSRLISLSFTPSNGILSPSVFNPNTLQYTYTIPRQLLGNVTVTATPVKPTTADWGNVELHQVVVNRHRPSAIITIIVIAQSGSTATYTVNVVMQADSSDATLFNLTINNGTLSPAFHPNTTAYTVSVPFAQTGRQVQAIATPPDGAIIVTSESTPNLLVNVSSSNPTATITIQVRSLNNTIRVYTIAVTMLPDSDNAFLTGLFVSEGAFDPIFNRHTFNYTLDIIASSVTVSYELLAGASIDYNASVLTITISSGQTQELRVVVIASDGTTRQTYTIVVRNIG
jgi:hypothetical protein